MINVQYAFTYTSYLKLSVLEQNRPWSKISLKEILKKKYMQKSYEVCMMSNLTPLRYYSVFFH